MSKSRLSFFAARVAAFTIVLMVPLFGATAVSAADPDPAPPATTNGHGWIG